MALIDKETICKEIERLEKHYLVREYDDGYNKALDAISKFLDTIPEQPVTDHREIELEFRGEKVTVSREFYRNGEMNYSTSEQDDNVIWAALRAWCEKKGITAFELYPKQEEQPVEGLKEEISRTYHDGSVADTEDIDHTDYENIARHFYELGCTRTAEMYDDIEYKRQRAEEAELSGDLEEEIGRFIDAVDQRTGGRWSEEDILECARHFAEWGRKQVLQEIYEGKVKPVDKITAA